MTAIAVLYPGAAGRALAEALASFRHDLVSCLDGRSGRTRENARCGGIRAVASFEEMVGTADLVVSLVPPAAALAVAERYAAALRPLARRGDGNRPRLFLDANSIAPGTVAAVEAAIAGAGGRLVDGVFLGPAAPFNRHTTLALSGADAPAVAEILAPAVAVKVIGPAVGQASALKMAMALMTKALVALFVECACAAGKAGCLDAMIEAMRQLYPGTMEFLERNLPTYPAHVGRRVGEMREVQAWLAGIGQAGDMTRAATHVLERLARAGLDGASAGFDRLLAEIVGRDPLAACGGIPAEAAARSPAAGREPGGRE